MQAFASLDTRRQAPACLCTPWHALRRKQRQEKVLSILPLLPYFPSLFSGSNASARTDAAAVAHGKVAVIEKMRGDSSRTRRQKIPATIARDYSTEQYVHCADLRKHCSVEYKNRTEPGVPSKTQGNERKRLIRKLGLEWQERGNGVVGSLMGLGMSQCQTPWMFPPSPLIENRYSTHYYSTHYFKS